VTDSAKKIVGEIGFPLVIFAVNPFIHDGYKTAANKSALYRALKSLGMNYKFAVCAQPLKGEMVTVKSFFGQSNNEQPEIQELSKRVYETFKIPVCKLHIQKTTQKAYLCALQPINKEEFSKQDLEVLSKQVKLISQQGEC
jgi:hypothetical protein